MKHKYLLLASAALASALGAHSTQPITADNTPAEGKTISVTIAGKPAPVPADSVKLNAKPGNYQVTVKDRPMAMAGSPFRFPEVPTRRKVKYGKSRWVILG